LAAKPVSVPAASSSAVAMAGRRTESGSGAGMASAGVAAGDPAMAGGGSVPDSTGAGRATGSASA
jgi:hypothetical protein